MDLDEIKRGLRAEIKKRENEQYFTFQCNVRQMCKDVLAKLEEQESEIAEKDKELRHQKYKRCLDNAWGCQQRMELFHELALEEARTIALPNEVALKENRRKRERAAKWRKRWLKLAEQFKDKEAK